MLSGYTAERAKEYMSQFFSCVLDATYSTYRYDPIFSQYHLAIIWQAYPQIRIEWMKGKKEDLNTYCTERNISFLPPSLVNLNEWIIEDTDDANTMLL